MLNYHKTYRESLDKGKRKPTPKKQPSINRSHTSSINLKLSQEPSKALLRNSKQNFDPSRKQSAQKIKSHLKTDFGGGSNVKYSFKIKPDPYDYYEGSRLRMKTNYDHSNVKPFQDSNRCLITERNSKCPEFKLAEKSLSKKSIHIRTEYREGGQIEGGYENDERTNQRIKEPSIRHNNQSLNSNSSQIQTVKVPICELKKLYQQMKDYENQLDCLKKQVSFYRKKGCPMTKNSVLKALAR